MTWSYQFIFVIKLFFTVAVFYVGYRIGVVHECPKEFPEQILEIVAEPCHFTQSASATKASCRKYPLTEPTNIYEYDGVSVLTKVFNTMYHPGPVADAELVLSENNSWKSIESCQSMYLMRGAFHYNDKAKPSTCIAIWKVPEIYASPKMHIHRFGYTPYPQKLTNQYQDDYIKPHGYRQEKRLLPPLLTSLPMIIQQLKDLLGDPVLPNGDRRTAIIMVANEGVMDIVLNTICSARSAGIDLSNQVLFLGQPGYEALVNNFGLKAIYHPSFGDIPSNAAGFYADVTFGYLMWLKVIAAHVASAAGYDVLFQDADVVWIRDPLPLLRSLPHDMLFMDDGARSPRFTPWGFNSGFYFMRHNVRTKYLQQRMIQLIGEITYTHSHQTTLTRYATECLYLFGLDVLVMKQTMFPSGYMYHKSKQFIMDIVAHKITPYVFHMCWTGTRTEKLRYLKELGMWYLPEENDEVRNKNDMCEKASVMLTYLNQTPGASIPDTCCIQSTYWKNKLKVDAGEPLLKQ